MDLRSSIVVVLTLSVVTSIRVAESSPPSPTYNDNHRFHQPQLLMVHGNHATPTRPRKCTGNVIGDDCVFEDEEMAMELGMSRRVLGQTKYISYAALAANSIPCNARGRSYYNCHTHQKVNPYNRGCSMITHCARGG
ncbi:PREDICTED: protein RALF-like 22 [Ipomoea nil]|uniref:protein RALF-like 22 n=1 Tax=Ipomoea nil TaxID=35883 RepID=UPI000901EB89|nr:PREDICTED: protein RALF-like 22 [Ipomoea nil]